MILTIKDILDDIASFQARISAAENKLATLPDGYLPYPEHKKREKERRELLSDIFHIKNLIRIAHEGIKLLEKEF